jgi:hypothetical protein
MFGWALLVAYVVVGLIVVLSACKVAGNADERMEQNRRDVE